MTQPFLNTDNAEVFYKIIETLGHASMGLHLSGEKGLCKEAIVRLLYTHSHHRGSPFIKVNCPMLSVPDETDNTPCINQVTSQPDISSFNLFRLFHQGVLYLHAVDEMDLALQRRILALIKRKLQSSSIASNGPKGATLIFSTSTWPLETGVAAGTFDPAFCELLSGVSIHIHPLRHSPERIAPLVDYFLNRNGMRERSAELLHPLVSHQEMMRKHRWPGNVKELQEVVRTAIRLNDWGAAISMLNCKKDAIESYSGVDLSSDDVTLMPDFEIRHGRVLERLAIGTPVEEMGLMDLVVFEEVTARNEVP